MGLLTIIKKQKLKDNEIRCLILGLDNSGKSTIVNRLLPKDQRSTEITPTVGFQIHTAHIQDRLVSLWDIGGQTTLRPFWDNYYDKTDVLVWCIDVSQPLRFDESARELFSFLQRDRGRPGHDLKLIVALNKIDLLSGSSLTTCVASVQDDLSDVAGAGAVFVRCSGVTGQGMEELSYAMCAD
ncbi:hypothetical protein HG536_0A03230 [Torulaspora globosa]|uniref:Uncharacterized protein n=1 Tax=Torulaspora globosa TaxID=48254 RepID=A0A7G3ZAG9_9SACH|nr:uncharacterized protein HG536_0A03230 [Torulaspora globosa]QLL30505.1 hypothetical protein HG536_0A03230 [Torulaspora globosa]